jgi:hypothetical protein
VIAKKKTASAVFFRWFLGELKTSKTPERLSGRVWWRKLKWCRQKTAGLRAVTQQLLHE